MAEVRCTSRSTVDLAWVLDTRCFSTEQAIKVDPGLAPGRAPLKPSHESSGIVPKGSSGPGLDSVQQLREAETERVAGNDLVEAGHRESVHDHADHAGHGEDCAECAEASSKEGPGGKACSVHDPAVTTCAVDLPGSLGLSRLERWLGDLLWEPPPGGTEVYRVKGVVSVEGRDERFVVQGVADVFEVAPAGVSGSAWREEDSRRCKIVFIGRLLSKKDLEEGVKSCMC